VLYAPGKKVLGGVSVYGRKGGLQAIDVTDGLGRLDLGQGVVRQAGSPYLSPTP
jgi:hypothetical protein